MRKQSFDLMKDFLPSNNRFKLRDRADSLLSHFLSCLDMVHEILSKEEFDQKITGSGDKLVVVDYTASWFLCAILSTSLISRSQVWSL